MPCLKIFTNVPKSKIPADFITKIIPVLAECVKKVPDRFICLVSPDCQLSIVGDTSTPGVVASLESIGNLGQVENKYISEKLTSFIESELGVPPRRCFISFYDLKPQDVGISATTMHYIEQT